MKKIITVALATTMALGLACTAYAGETAEKVGGQIFLTDEESAQTYVNPLCLDYQRSIASDKGVIPENPFMVGQMIGNDIIPNDPVESITHARRK